MAVPKGKKPEKVKPNIKPKPTKRLTPYEQQQVDLNTTLETMIQEINSLYINLENLLVYTTIVANVNAALANILIKKKITTEKGIAKEYDKIVADMKKKQQEFKDMNKKIIDDLSGHIDFSNNINLKDLKVS